MGYTLRAREGRRDARAPASSVNDRVGRCDRGIVQDCCTDDCAEQRANAHAEQRANAHAVPQSDAGTDAIAVCRPDLGMLQWAWRMLIRWRMRVPWRLGRI